MIYNQINPHGGDIYTNAVTLDYSANINPFGPPKSVLDSIIASLDNIAAYPDAACGKLRQAISSFEDIDIQHILCGNGAAELIFLLVQTLAAKTALIVQPTFCEYELALKTAGTNVSYYHLAEEQNFQLDETILTTLDSQPDILFICNPNNPTGTVAEKTLMEKILNKCAALNILLFIDECFLEFTGAVEAFSMKSFLSQYQNLFILKAFTKSYALPGLRLGYCLCSDQTLLSKMSARIQPWNVSIPAQAAGIAALKETAYLRQAIELIDSEREVLIKELTKIGVKVYHGKANFLLLKASLPLYQPLLKKGILIRQCHNFPGLNDNYYRIAIRRPEQNHQLLTEIREVYHG